MHLYLETPSGIGLGPHRLFLITTKKLALQRKPTPFHVEKLRGCASFLHTYSCILIFGHQLPTPETFSIPAAVRLHCHHSSTGCVERERGSEEMPLQRLD